MKTLHSLLAVGALVLVGSALVVAADFAATPACAAKCCEANACCDSGKCGPDLCKTDKCDSGKCSKTGAVTEMKASCCAKPEVSTVPAMPAKPAGSCCAK